MFKAYKCCLQKLDFDIYSHIYHLVPTSLLIPVCLMIQGVTPLYCYNIKPQYTIML